MDNINLVEDKANGMLVNAVISCHVPKKCKNFREYLRNCQFLKKTSAPWSQLFTVNYSIFIITITF